MKKQINKINLIYILSFLGDALFSPFLALYFSSLGIEETKKGILLALIPLSSLLGSLFYGKLSNTSKRNLLIIRILVMAQLIVMSILGFIDNYILLILFTFVFAFHNNTFFSFQDGLAVDISNKEKKIYANTRIFGTIGYFLGSLLGGVIIDLSSFGVIFLLAGIIYAVVELLFFFIKVEDEETVQKVPITFKQVLVHKQYVFYLIAYILILGTWNIEEAYVSLTFESMGVSASSWGYIFAYQILIEMIVIFIVNRLIKQKFSPKVMLLISFGLIICRSLFLGLDMLLWLKVFLVATLRGLSWGLFLSFHMELVKKLLPNELVTKAVLIFAICSNIFATSGNYLAPYIYQNLSFNAMYLILMILQILGLSIFMVFVFFWRGKSKK